MFGKREKETPIIHVQIGGSKYDDASSGQRFSAVTIYDPNTGRSEVALYPVVKKPNFPLPTGAIFVDGKEYPVVEVSETNLSVARTWLGHRYRHLGDLLETMLSDLKDGGHLIFKPTIFLGEKQVTVDYLLRDLAKLLGIGVKTLDCAENAKSGVEILHTLRGMDQHFQCANPSVFYENIVRYGVANSILHLKDVDVFRNPSPEIDFLREMVLWKSAHYPSDLLCDRYFRAFIEVRLVSPFLSYRNSCLPIPGPIRDSYRILQVDDPYSDDASAFAEWKYQRMAMNAELKRLMNEDASS